MPPAEEVSVLVPDEREYEGFKERECSEDGPVAPRYIGELVDDEEREDDERGGVGPELVLDETPDEESFDDAVRQKIDRPEELETGREMRGEARDMGGEEVVRILDELAFDERQDDRGELWREEQADAENDLRRGAHGFEDEADEEYLTYPLFGYVDEGGHGKSIIGQKPRNGAFVRIVRGRGLAPPRLTAHAPQACLATITTPAHYYVNIFNRSPTIAKIFSIFNFFRVRQIQP